MALPQRPGWRIQHVESFYPDDLNNMSIEDACAMLMQKAEGLIDPFLKKDYWNPTVNIYTWERIPEEERIKAERKAEKAREKRRLAAERRKQRVRDAELEQLAKLKAKYEQE